MVVIIVNHALLLNVKSLMVLNQKLSVLHTGMLHSLVVLIGSSQKQTLINMMYWTQQNQLMVLVAWITTNLKMLLTDAREQLLQLRANIGKHATPTCGKSAVVFTKDVLQLSTLNCNGHKKHIQTRTLEEELVKEEMSS